jgi:hypothetical protein
VTLFLQGEEPSVLLVGLAMFPESADADAPGAVFLGDDAHYEVHSQYLPFLDFVRTPRRESELISWLAEEAADPDTADALVESGKIRRILPGAGFAVLRQFSGLALRPAAITRLTWPEDEPPVEGIAFVGYPERQDLALPVSTTLVEVMWDSLAGEDIVGAVTRLAKNAGGDLEEFASEAIEWLPGLLASGYAYLSPVKVSA